MQINQTDNSINGNVRIVLRGNRSLTGNNQALIVLDGVQVPTDVYNSLNQNDIESITVLKGASAAALYGSDASNGVLIINTKRGTVKSAPSVTLSSTTQIEEVSYYPHLQTRFGGYGGEGPGPDVYNIDPNFPGGYVAYENQSYGPAFNGALVPVGRPIYQNGVPVYQYTTYSPKLNDHLNFWKKGVTQQTAASISGGGENSTFYFSFQDANRSGVVPHDQYRRDNMSFRGSQTHGVFKMGYSVIYTLTHQNINYNPNFYAFGQQGGQVYWDWFNTQMQVPLTQYQDWQNDPFSTNTGYYNDFYNNPYFDIDANRRNSTQQDFLGNIDLSIKPLKWLEVIGKANLSNTTFQAQDITLPNIYLSQYDPTANPDGVANPNKYNVQQGNTPAGVNNTDTYRRQITAFLMSRISHNFNQDFGFQFLFGANLKNLEYNGMNLGSATLAYLNPIIYNTNYRNGNLNGGTSIANQNLVAAFGDLTLTYKYLTLHGSLRNDWTSLLATNNRSFSYPEADLAFVFTEAIPALQNNRIISYGKITASTAKVGNVNIGPYQLQTIFNAGTPYGQVSVNYLGSGTVAASLKPEFTTQNEFGLEMGFLNNRLNFKGSYYQSKTINQTVPFTVSRATGYQTALINTGEVDNSGVELELNYKVLSTSSGFTWNFFTNYTYLHNTVSSIYTSPSGDVFNSINIPQADGNGGVSNAYAVVGKLYPQIEVTDWNRDPQGRVIVDPITGLPSRASGLVDVGSANPTNRLGIGSNFSYKGITLSFLFDYRAGGYIYNQLGQGIEFGGLGYVSAEAGRQRFVYPNSVIAQTDGQGNTTYVPNTNVTVNDGNYNFWQNIYNNVGTNYVTKSDFWKLREVTLSYALPGSLMQKTKFIKTATVSLTGRNLLMWRPASNQWTDPEFSTDTSNAAGTTSLGQTPPTRMYGLNLTLTF